MTVALAAVMTGLLVGSSTWASGAQADEPAGAVVLIGTGGIGWSDVDQQTTPNLWQLLRDGSSAALSVRSVYSNTCPIDGWLGVSAGLPRRRAAPRGRAATPRTGPARPRRPWPTASVLQWPSYLEAAADERFDSRLGLLGDTAAAGKVCVKAVQPFAAAGGARRDGRIEQYSPWSDAAADGRPQRLPGHPRRRRVAAGPRRRRRRRERRGRRAGRS